MMWPPPRAEVRPWSLHLTTQSTSHEIRFGEYAIELRSGELRRNGAVLKLQPQPAKVLAILVSRAGEVVTRQELADQVWGSETYVDFEHGLNYAIRQIRSVLEDDAVQPRFLETIPKRGYRFIAPVSSPTSTGQAVPPVVTPVEMLHAGTASNKILHTAAAVVLAAIMGLTWYVRSSFVHQASASQIRSLAVLPLRNLSNDPSQEYFSDGMTDELITDLAKSGGLRVISHTSSNDTKAQNSRCRRSRVSWAEWTPWLKGPSCAPVTGFALQPN